jgi:hypothetical protein
MPWLRLPFAYVVALGFAVAAAGVLHMQLVLAEFPALGVQVGWLDRLAATAVTVRGFIPTLGPVLAAGLLVAFAVAAALKRVLTPLAPAAYPLAGAAAMATAIVLMNLEYETTPIASARTAVGFATLCASTALAGVLFAVLAGPGLRARTWALLRTARTWGSLTLPSPRSAGSAAVRPG